MHLFPKIMDLVKANRMDDVLVFGGGIIPDQDVPKLKEIGVAAIFQPGATTDAAIEFLKANVRRA